MRARELLFNAQPQMIRIFTIMMLINLVTMLLNGNSGLMQMISLIVTILFLTFEHGYIVSSLKVARNDYHSLNDDDAVVGFKRIKELFTTYLIRYLILMVVVFVLLLIMLLLARMMFGSAIDYLIILIRSYSGYYDMYSILYTWLSLYPNIAYFIIICMLILVVIAYILSIYLFATPYLLEQFHLKNTQAISESFQFIKGYKFDLFKLQFSFLGWMILVGVIDGFMLNFLSFIPIVGSLIASVVSGFVAIYTYLPQYHVSQAIFFEEVAYQRYAMQSQSNEYYTNQYNDYYNYNDGDVE